MKKKIIKRLKRIPAAISKLFFNYDALSDAWRKLPFWLKELSNWLDQNDDFFDGFSDMIS